MESGQCVPVETRNYVTRVAGPALTTHGPSAISQAIPLPQLTNTEVEQMDLESPLGLILSLNRIRRQASRRAGDVLECSPRRRPRSLASVSFSLCFSCLDRGATDHGNPEEKRDSPGCFCSALELRMVLIFSNG